MEMMLIIGVIAYLIGCINPAIIIGNITNIDIRKEGSCNPGASNVLRVMGWKAALITVTSEVLIGYLAAILGKQMEGYMGTMVAFALVLIGHAFPAFYKFKGGNVVAVAFGAAFALNFPSAMLVLMVGFIVMLSTMKMSIGALSAALAYPMLICIYLPNQHIIIYFALGVAAFVMLMNVSAIKRLLKRAEPDITINVREKLLSTDYLRINPAKANSDKSTDSPFAQHVEVNDSNNEASGEPEPMDYYDGVKIPKLPKDKKFKIGVIGNGSFGTAMANLLVHNGYDVMLYGRDKEAIEKMKETNMNEKYLPYVLLSSKIKYTNNISTAVKGRKFVVMAVPTQQFRAVAKKVAKYIEKDTIVVNLAKGIEQGSTDRLSQIADEVLPKQAYVALSGPTHAEEIVRNYPSSIVAASTDAKAAKLVQDVFMNDRLRVYTQDDLVGVELAGALKNVIAIATGICDGMKFGANARAALMTRAIHEIERMGKVLGAKEQTFAGLAGIGDLMVTCTTNLSRNRRCGLFIGFGLDVDEAVKKVGSTVEGFFTAEAVCELADKENIDMPICQLTNKVLKGELEISEAFETLMARPKKDEKE